MISKIPHLDLVQRYNLPVPRYTSYPTVPFWPQTIDTENWKERVIAQFDACNTTDGISLYLHLPLCESLCTYCVCNKKITTNYSVEMPYLMALLEEWKHYKSMFNGLPIIWEIHLGGGTPTLFSPANIDTLLTEIKTGPIMHPKTECSIEGHPNNTHADHIDVFAGMDSGASVMVCTIMMRWYKP